MARACAFKIGPDVETNMHSLPFVDAWIGGLAARARGAVAGTLRWLARCAHAAAPRRAAHAHVWPLPAAKQIQEILHGFKDARPEYQCETLANFRWGPPPRLLSPHAPAGQGLAGGRMRSCGCRRAFCEPSPFPPGLAWQG